ncbi:hypothetical protein E8E14_003149 [Neopestalotiopsis sp. 37M]|nr:hypothetical protein E8E14_003149 [Neopestalotiopsis sp. 37M]
MDAEMEARTVGGGGLPDDGSTLVTIANPILPSPTNPNLVQAEAEGLVSAKRARGLRAKVWGRWWSIAGGRLSTAGTGPVVVSCGVSGRRSGRVAESADVDEDTHTHKHVNTPLPD